MLASRRVSVCLCVCGYTVSRLPFGHQTLVDIGRGGRVMWCSPGRERVVAQVSVSGRCL